MTRVVGLSPLRAISRRERDRERGCDRDMLHIYERTREDQFEALCGGDDAETVVELRPGIYYCGRCLDRRFDELR